MLNKVIEQTKRIKKRFYNKILTKYSEFICNCKKVNIDRFSKENYKFWDIVELIDWKTISNERKNIEIGYARFCDVVNNKDVDFIKYEMAKTLRAKVDVLKDSLEEYVLDLCGSRYCFFGLSDDSFHYLCTYIVGCGKDEYEMILSNPEFVYPKYIETKSYCEGFEHIFN